MIEEREYSSSGVLASNFRYTWGADLSGTRQGAGGVGGLLMAEEIPASGSATAHFYAYDGNGNVTYVLDVSGAIEASYRYSAFGGDMGTTASTTFAQRNPWRFSTKYLDKEVEKTEGFYYFGYRHYLTALGRWPSRDPIGEQGGINLYGMVGNKPIFVVDILGLDWAEYSGQKVTIYGGNPGDRGTILSTGKGSSGLPGSQDPSKTGEKEHGDDKGGPIPEGKWNVDLRPDPNRVAIQDPKTGDMKLGDGIEKIPHSPWPNGGWGDNRAHLEPMKGTDSKGRTSVYAHDSDKDYSHGCLESDALVKAILAARAKGQKDFEVHVKYTDPTTGNLKPKP